MNIFVNVVNQKLKISSNQKKIINGTQEFIKFTFNLSDDWDGLSPYAQFKQNGIAYNRYLDKNNSVYLPSKIKVGTFSIMIYGSDSKTIAITDHISLDVIENIHVPNAEFITSQDNTSNTTYHLTDESGYILTDEEV